MEKQKKKPATKKEPKPLSSGTFFAAPVIVAKDGITIKLPLKVAQYLQLTNKVFWAPINGVIQISGTQPHMVIPMLSVNEHQFVAHKE